MIFNHKNASLLIGFIKEPENALNITLYLHHKNSSNCFDELFWPFGPKLVGTPDGVGEVPDWMKNGTKIHF